MASRCSLTAAASAASSLPSAAAGCCACAVAAVQAGKGRCQLCGRVERGKQLVQACAGAMQAQSGVWR